MTDNPQPEVAGAKTKEITRRPGPGVGDRKKNPTGEKTGNGDNKQPTPDTSSMPKIR